MEEKILTATIAVITALATVYLKSRYDQRNSEKNALRDYEYEAKKRLYQTYEPLFFQFTELAELALGRIKGIAICLREESYIDEWENFKNYYFRETIYKIFVPIATIKLIKDKLTSVDLSIDENLSCQYSLLKILYYSFQEDYKIARAINDEIYDKNWLKTYRTDNAEIERQGLNITELDKFLKLLIKDSVSTFSVIEIGEYEDILFNHENDVKKQRSLKIIEKLFKNFSVPEKRILWMMLLVHACVYYILTETKGKTKLKKIVIVDYVNKFFLTVAVGYKAIADENQNKLYFEGSKVYLLKQIDKHIN